MNNYEIWLTNDVGMRLLQLNNFKWLMASKSTRSLGSLQLGLQHSFDINYLRPDCMIQVWRAPTEGGQKKLWQAYFIREWLFMTQGAVKMLRVYGFGPKELLCRRIIAAYSESTEATKTDYADDMMKEFVTECFSDTVDPTPSAGSRQLSGLSVAGENSAGPTISYSAPWKKLLSRDGGGTLANIQRAAKKAGTEIFFDVEPYIVTTKSINFIFRTKTDQPGFDRTDEVVFSLTKGNLTNISFIYDYSDEVNFIYAGGQDQKTHREIQQVYDASRYNDSQWNRCEGFEDARTSELSNSVREEGRAALEEGRPKVRFKATPISTEATRFGREWDWGDKIRARYENVEFDAIIRAVTLTIDSDGNEKIDARMEYES